MKRFFLILCIIFILCGIGASVDMLISKDRVETQLVKVEQNKSIYLFTIKKVYHQGELLPYSIQYVNDAGEVVADYSRN